MMKELSAGGIIFYRGTTGVMVLVMKDRKGVWTFPKGKIEEGEDLETTAVREIAEEVGIRNLTLVGALTPASYWYFRTLPIRKTVHFFVFLSKSPQKPVVQTEEGITAATWLPVEEAKKVIGYPNTNLPLITEALDILAVSG
jgi:8-oxo-dGTP pyrophosphatase MutT (NUDIX family)